MHSSSKGTSKVWLIVGPSRAFSSELQRQLHQDGHKVAVFTDLTDRLSVPLPQLDDNWAEFRVDVRDPEDMRNAVEDVVEGLGQIDFLVNTTDSALIGAVEEVSDSEFSTTFESNILNLLRVIRSVLPVMRKARRGHIVNLLSKTRCHGRPGWGATSAANTALESMSLALRAEVEPLGIGLSVVDTMEYPADIAGGYLRVGKRVIEDYYDTAGRARLRLIEPGSHIGSDPVLSVRTMIDALLSNNPPQRMILGRAGYNQALQHLEDARAELGRIHELAMACEQVA